MNQKEFLIISITLFLTVIVWIIADLYHVSIEQQVTEANPRFSKPIKVSVPIEIFDILEKKQ